MDGILVVLAVVVVIVVIVVAIYNALVGKRMRCKEGWAQIDVQLKRRYDLIPNLVETVKGYASHEKDTLEAVINARNAAISAGSVAEQGECENMLSGALKQIFALSESYPDLKANQNFAQLQEELTSTENKIAFSRQHYNDSVGVYNMARQKFPSNIVANTFNFAAEEFFELTVATEREVPKVSF